MSYILILGATSDIARCLAGEYARRGYDLFLAARASETLGDLAAGLSERHRVKVALMNFEVRNIAGHEAFFHSLDPMPEGIVCLVGTLGRGPTHAERLEDLTEVAEVNFLGPAALVEVAAEAFESRGSGFIVGVSSVAGERGRQSNYPYGSAKAGFTAYLSGLRQRLQPIGVQVLTVKPGYVRTRMTQGMELPPIVTAEPEEVARSILRAQQAGKSVLYVRWIWRPIMAVIRMLPEGVFKRLRL